tara:strand:- start:380 stop:562 length:183 start_codon:yes stop_codon:yes gene_type:complete
MTKEKARELLNSYLKNNPIPIFSAVVYSETNFAEMSCNDWTFKGLLCLLYDDLEMKKINE